MDAVIFGAEQYDAGRAADWSAYLADGTSLYVLKDADVEFVKRFASYVRGTIATVHPLPGLPLPPDYPMPDGLKNRVCLTETTIARYVDDVDLRRALMITPDVRGASLTDYGWFVEFGSDTGDPLEIAGSLWAERVVTWRDARVLA